MNHFEYKFLTSIYKNLRNRFITRQGNQDSGCVTIIRESVAGLSSLSTEIVYRVASIFSDVSDKKSDFVLYEDDIAKSAFLHFWRKQLSEKSVKEAQKNPGQIFQKSTRVTEDVQRLLMKRMIKQL